MDNTPWMTLAKQYMGQHEILGAKDNQFILDCFKYTGYKAHHDEVPWCAAFVCRMLEETHNKSTKSAAAASYENFGLASELKPGCIIVFKWPGGGHHVTFCHHIVDSTHVACIGGNQSDMVKISVFPRHSIVATRWPVQ